MCFKKFLSNRRKYLENYRLEKQIKRLTEAERQEILEKSPLQAGYFQGTGYDVFLKSEPDFEKAYVYVLGHVMKEFAEDWIIKQYVLANRENSD
jgi:hypothetical protein